MYTLYTDRDEVFECDINIRNASLKDSSARLILESNGTVLLFEGKIKNNKCQIPIRRMHGIFKEWQKGRMHLEVIVENVYFKPWSSNFVVEKHTKLEIEEVKNSISKSPDIDLSIRNEKKKLLKENKILNERNLIKLEIEQILKKFDVTKQTVLQNRGIFKNIIKEYFSMNPEYLTYKKYILNNIWK